MSINRRKGQALTPDFIAGLSVFGAVLIFGMSMFATTYSNNAEFQQFEDVQRQSINLLDVMIRSPGIPANWTNETVKIVGLVEDDHVLSGEKILALKHVDETKLRQLFGIGNYGFYLTIENSTGIVVYDDTELSYGTSPSSSAESIIYGVRYASLIQDGKRSTVSLKFKVWK